MGGGGNALYSKRSLKPYALCFLSILCIHFGIASYQPFIDTALILLCGGIVAIIIDNKGNLKTSLYKSRFLIISVVLAGISYKITLDILKKLGTVSESYNNQMIPLGEMLERIILATKMAFQALFAYNVDFMPPFIAVLFGTLTVLFVALLFGSKLDFRAKVSVCVVLFGAIVASQAHIILSKNISTGIITDYYGMLFLRVLIIALVFKAVEQMPRTQTIMRNLVFGLSCVIIWACVIQSLNVQKVLKLTMERDFHYINRIVARIESNENFSYEKKYCGVLFGKPQNAFREGFNTDILPIWEMEQVFRYTMSKNVFEGCKMYSDLMQDFVDNNHKENKAFNTLIFRLHKAGILDKLQPYPHKDSVVVFEDIIVFVASKGNLDEIKQMAKTLDNKGAVQ